MPRGSRGTTSRRAAHCRRRPKRGIGCRRASRRTAARTLRTTAQRRFHLCGIFSRTTAWTNTPRSYSKMASMSWKPWNSPTTMFFASSASPAATLSSCASGFARMSKQRSLCRRSCSNGSSKRGRDQSSSHLRRLSRGSRMSKSGSSRGGRSRSMTKTEHRNMSLCGRCLFVSKICTDHPKRPMWPRSCHGSNTSSLNIWFKSCNQSRHVQSRGHGRRYSDRTSRRRRSDDNSSSSNSISGRSRCRNGNRSSTRSCGRNPLPSPCPFLSLRVNRTTMPNRSRSSSNSITST
mmetsp:Transcript_74313/g.214788  ORF Transcript_74313/g.214788 Transcript_74313/m.214788 type:complete len:291 (-) Transcript_74313:1095-1967(-)